MKWERWLLDTAVVVGDPPSDDEEDAPMLWTKGSKRKIDAGLFSGSSSSRMRCSNLEMCSRMS
jgi:hypothetical protein